MDNIVKVIEWEGSCKLGQPMSIAKQDVIDQLEQDMELENQKEVFVNGDGWWTDTDNQVKDGKVDVDNSVVYYLFKVSLTKEGVDKLHD